MARPNLGIPTVFMAFHKRVVKFPNTDISYCSIGNTFPTPVYDLPLLEEDCDNAEIKPIQLP